MKLLLATGNPHKIREIESILQVDGLELATLKDYPGLPEVIEDQPDFTGNAVKKAVTLARAAGVDALADDSGLEVDALGGEPGVYSARYSGIHGDDCANNAKLLAHMRDVDDRSARFRCVIALANPDGGVDTVEGLCEGEIAFEPAGDNGFGYDPIFIPGGFKQTFAQLGAEIKNHISHRSQALEKAYRKWFAD